MSSPGPPRTRWTHQPLTGILGRAALLDGSSMPSTLAGAISRSSASRRNVSGGASPAWLASARTTPPVRRRASHPGSEAGFQHAKWRSGGAGGRAHRRGPREHTPRGLRGGAVGGHAGHERVVGRGLGSLAGGRLGARAGSGRVPSDLLLATANQLSSREIPAVMIDPAGGTVPSATIEHLGALVPEGAPPTVASIERELRRAHRLGRLLRRLEGGA